MTAQARPAAIAADEYRTIPIGQLKPSPSNPRRHSDPKAIAELAGSIRAHGILQPILVRPKGAGFEIAAGWRRYLAAQEAGLTELPARVRELSDVDVLEIQTVENLQREDIHPLDEAIGYRALMERAGYDAEHIAAKVGKSASYVYQRLKLAELIEPLQEVFLDGRMTASHAVLLARLQPKDQKRAIQDRLFEGHFHGSGKIPKDADVVSVRDLTHWIHEEILLDLHAAPWKKDDATLLPKAGPCTTCPKRAGNQPQLFPDVKKGDTCTDPGCFAAKMAAFVERKTAELKEQGGQPPLRLATQNQPDDKSLIGTERWAVVPAGSCEHVRTGIVVETNRGSDHHRRGQVLTVCAEPKCRKHHSPYGAPIDRSQARKKTAAELRRDLEEKIKSTTRWRALDATLQRVKEPAPLPLLRLIAKRFVADIWHEFRKEMVKRHQLQPQKRKGAAGYDIDKALFVFIDDAGGDDVTRFLVETALIKDAINGPSPLASERYELPAIAKLLKVDPIQIEREVRKELTAAAKVTAQRRAQRQKKSAPRPRRKVQASAMKAKRAG